MLEASLQCLGSHGQCEGKKMWLWIATINENWYIQVLFFPMHSCLGVSELQLVNRKGGKERVAGG